MASLGGGFGGVVVEFETERILERSTLSDNDVLSCELEIDCDEISDQIRPAVCTYVRTSTYYISTY